MREQTSSGLVQPMIDQSLCNTTKVIRDVKRYKKKVKTSRGQREQFEQFEVARRTHPRGDTA